jgi:hypothetical protein
LNIISSEYDNLHTNLDELGRSVDKLISLVDKKEKELVNGK